MRRAEERLEVRKTAGGRRRTLVAGVAGDAALRLCCISVPELRGVCEECVRSVDCQRAPRGGSLRTGLRTSPDWPGRRWEEEPSNVSAQEPFRYFSNDLSRKAKNVSPAPVIFYFLPVRLSEAISPLFSDTGSLGLSVASGYRRYKQKGAAHCN